MYPILFESGGFVLPAWHTFFILGAIASYILFVFLRRQYIKDIEESDLANIYAFGYLGGYFGARIFSIFNDQSVTEFGDFLVELVSLGPMTFYGGFLGTVFVVYAYCYFRKVSFKDVADLALPSGMLGVAYGRVGCFLNGDDFGKVVAPEYKDSWWSVVFPNLNDGMARYPSQLIETVFCLALVSFIYLTFKPIRSRFGNGAVGAVTIAIYAVYRFFAEYLRGDLRGDFFNGLLSTSQLISILVLLFLTSSVLVQRFLRRE